MPAWLPGAGPGALLPFPDGAPPVLLRRPAAEGPVPLMTAMECEPQRAGNGCSWRMKTFVSCNQGDSSMQESEVWKLHGSVKNQEQIGGVLLNQSLGGDAMMCLCV